MISHWGSTIKSSWVRTVTCRYLSIYDLRSCKDKTTNQATKFLSPRWGRCGNSLIRPFSQSMLHSWLRSTSVLNTAVISWISSGVPLSSPLTFSKEHVAQRSTVCNIGVRGRYLVVEIVYCWTARFTSDFCFAQCIIGYPASIELWWSMDWASLLVWTGQ